VGTYCSQPPSDSPRLLWSQIEREILTFLVVLPKVLASLLVGHGQHPSDRLANGITTKSKKKHKICKTISISPCKIGGKAGDEHLGQFGSRPTSDFLYAQGQEIASEFIQLLGQVALGPTKKIERHQHNDGQSEWMCQPGLTRRMRTLTGVRRP